MMGVWSASAPSSSSEAPSSEASSSKVCVLHGGVCRRAVPRPIPLPLSAPAQLPPISEAILAQAVPAAAICPRYRKSMEWNASLDTLDSGPIDKSKVVKMMKQQFSKTQRSSLWQMGDKLIMESSSPQGKEAWQEMKAKGESTHRKGKTEAKNNMLALCLAFGDKWEKHMAVEVRSIVDSRKKRMLQLLLHFCLCEV